MYVSITDSGSDRVKEKKNETSKDFYVTERS